MDAERFDRFTRALSFGSSRRGVLAGLASGLVTSLWPGGQEEAAEAATSARCPFACGQCQICQRGVCRRTKRRGRRCRAGRCVARANGTPCSGGTCQGGSCSSPTCSDGIRNNNETDIDCGGGTCPRCSPGKRCNVRTDCTSALCNGGICTSCITDGDCGPGCLCVQPSGTSSAAAKVCVGTINILVTNCATQCSLQNQVCLGTGPFACTTTCGG